MIVKEDTVQNICIMKFLDLKSRTLVENTKLILRDFVPATKVIKYDLLVVCINQGDLNINFCKLSAIIDSQELQIAGDVVELFPVSYVLK